MNMNTAAGAAGRIAGTTVRIANQIDWTEVAQIVLHGLQILIVLALLAGRATRRAWDALLAMSERLGRWYAGLIVRQPVPPVVKPLPARVTMHPLAELGEQLEQLTCRELQQLTGCRRKLAKRELIALALAW